MNAWLATPWLLGLALAAVALASWAASGAVLRLLIAWRVYDEPNHRSSHAQPKPRGGGLALVPLILAAWILGTLTSGGGAKGDGVPGDGYLGDGFLGDGFLGDGFWQVVAGALLLGAISWADDLKPRPASLRFGVQVAAVFLGLSALAPGVLVFQGLLPLPLDRVLTALLWLWFINLFNFMDGIDGISGVETVAIAGGLALVAVLGGLGAFAVYTAAVPAAAALGFLYWNWAPSRLFLGDVGSVPLGYLLGALLIAAAAGGLWSVALILPLYYLADATWTLGRRALRGERVWRAHREHFYQRAVQRGFSHAAVAGRIAVCNTVLVVLALYAAASPGPAAPWIALGLALLAVIFLLFMLARQKPPAPKA